jgi:hypothetical protein
MSIFLEENWNIQEKRSGMKKLWKKFRLHFAIPTRQRDKETMKKLTSTSTSASTSTSYYYHQAKNEEKWIEYKNLEIYNIRKNIWRKKSSTISLKEFPIRRISGEEHQVP